MNSGSKRKIIFAKATAYNFCAIAVYRGDGKLMLSDIVESDSISQFIEDVTDLARKHAPELLQYECSVYLTECKELRQRLSKENIRVRGYKSEGGYLNRIVSEAGWIENNVLVNEKFPSFIDRMLSFSASDTDKTNIALDILSDATKYIRRHF